MYFTQNIDADGKKYIISFIVSFLFEKISYENQIKSISHK